MCTVTYLPFNEREFILSSNRDEDISRLPALHPQEYKIHGRTVFFPRDQKANGTWIAYDVKGYTLCLLNGANEPHVQKERYKKSRGLVLLDFYLYNEPELFATQYDFTGIEPFTLILAYSCSDTESVLLYELKWNEKELSLYKLDSSLPHIWSSVTLYSKETIEQREKWFAVWLEENTNYNSESILFFHHFGGDGSQENNVLMDRGVKKTVSICLIQNYLSQTTIIYEDLIKKVLHKSKVINC